MRLVVVLAVLSMITPSLAEEVVGRVDGYLIIKKRDIFKIVPQTSEEKNKETDIKENGRNELENVYSDIIERLKRGEGEPVYSRIKGFDVERVLDAGPFFGAVISGRQNEAILRKAFKKVVKVGNKYYVAGEWK